MYRERRHYQSKFKKTVSFFLAVFLLLTPTDNFIFAAATEDSPWVYDVARVNNTGVVGGQYGDYQDNYNIDLPLGVNGLTPSVQITYSSQASEYGSVAGFGWSLSVPSVTRMNKMGVDKMYTRSDFLSSYDGELTEFGTNEFIPRVQTGGFKTYKKHEGHWVTYNQEGIKYTYGSTTSARQKAYSTSTDTYAWYLDEIEDTNGNKIVYEYVQGQGKVYPSKIFYGYDSFGDNAYEVRFIYASSTRYISYEPGFAEVNDRILKSIEVYFDDNLMSEYDIDYENQTGSPVNLLSSIHKIGYDQNGVAASGSPRTFEYIQESPNWINDSDFASSAPSYLYEQVDDYWGTSYSHYSRDQILDMNGDGLVDWVTGNAVYLNTGDGWETSASWALPVTNVNHENRLVDINGDLLPDIVTSKKESWDPYYSTADVYTKVVRINQGDGTWVIDTLLAEYIPGDFYWQYHAYPSGINYYDRDVFFIDMNGDGLQDWIYEGYVYLNSGAGWATTSTWNILPSGSEPFNLKWRLSDVNGDGLPDLIKSDTVMYDPRFTGYTNYYANQVLLNKGNGEWEINTDWGSTIPSDFNSRFYIQYWNYPGGITYYKNRVYLLDANGDGLSDWLYNNKALLNTGNGWATSTIDLPISVEDLIKSYRMVDIDGDTQLDFVRYLFKYFFGTITHTKEALINNSQRQWLLSTTTNEYGGVTSITYDVTTSKENGQLHNPKNPVVKYVVSKVTKDPLIGSDITTTFTYADGSLYFSTSTPFDRKFAGFGSVTSETSLGKNKTYYHQGNGNTTSSHESFDGYAKIGMPYRTEVYDSGDDLYKVNTTFYDKWSTGTSSDFIKKIKEIDLQYDGDGDHRDTATEFVYDSSTGLVTSKIEYGEVNASTNGSYADIGLDKRTTEYEYASSESYNILGLLSKETLKNNLGVKVKESKYYYDNQLPGLVTLGNLTKRDDWIGESQYINTELAYNNSGLLSSVTDPRGNTTTYDYDAFDLYVSSSTNAKGHNVQYTYDYSSGKVATTTDANGKKFVTIYDGLDRPLELIGPDPQTGNLVTQSTYSYIDTPGAIRIHEVIHLTPSLTNSKYTYLDGFGKLVQERVGAEEVDQYSVKDYLYGNHGLLHKQSLPYFSTGSSRTTATTDSDLLSLFAYDPLLRITSVQTAVGVTQYAYDQWKETVTDTANNDKVSEYDAYGRLVQVTENNGSNSYDTNYAWSASGDLVKLTDAEGNIRNITYDGLGRRVVLEDLHDLEDGSYGVWSFAYDAAGNVSSTTDPKGQVMNYTYDDINRVLTEDYLGTGYIDIAYSYDSCENGITKICFVGNENATTTYSYTPNGLTASESRDIRGVTYITEYEYDRFGNKTLITYPDSSEVRYTYNRANKIDKVEQRENGGLFADVVKDYDYGPHGLVTYQKNGNDSETTKTYYDDEMYRMRSIVTIATTTYGTGGPGMEFAEIDNLLVSGDIDVLVSEATISETEDETEEVLENSDLMPAEQDNGSEEVDEILANTDLENSDSPLNDLLNSNPTDYSSSSKSDHGDLVKDFHVKEKGVNPNKPDNKKPFATSTVEYVGPEDYPEDEFVLASSEIQPAVMSMMSGGTSTKTVVLQPGSEGKDTHYGTVYRTGGMPNEPYFSIGGWGDWYYSFIEFNLASLPPADQIVSAHLNLYSHYSTSLSNNATLDRVTQSWTESGLTKANNPTYTSTGIPWSFVPLGGWWNNDITTIVKNWVNNIYPNYGLRIRAQYNNGNKGRSFHSSEEMVETTRRPKLTLVVIIYAPEPPTDLLVGGVSNPVDLNDDTPDFSAVFNDANGISEVATHYQIQVDDNPTFGSLFWDSGKMGMASTSEGSRSPDLEYSGPQLASSTEYFWRIKLWDQDDLEGEWSISTSTFSLASGTITTPPPPPPPTVYGGVQNLQFTYDSVGNITQIVDRSETVLSATTTFTYDGLHRLSSASTTGASSTPYAHTYTYSPIGNVLAKSDVGVYAYTETGNANPHAATAVAGVSQTYDDNGNLVATGDGEIYDWNHRNQLISSTVGSNNVSYGYDHAGARVYKDDTSVVTLYPSNLYEVTGTSTKKHIYANGSLVATIESDTPAPKIYYAYTNHLGSTNVVLGQDGYINQIVDYYPFGDARIDQTYGSGSQDIQYVGTRHDTETDLNYMNARYYDGTRGQFISQDPVFRAIGNPSEIQRLTKVDLNKVLMDPQALNSYNYARNNPIRYSDPEGLWFKEFATGQQSFSDFRVEVGQATQYMTDNSPAWNYAVSNPGKAGAVTGLVGGAAFLAGVPAAAAFSSSIVPVSGVGKVLVTNRLIEGSIYTYLAADSLSNLPNKLQNAANVKQGDLRSYGNFTGSFALDYGPGAFGEHADAIGNIVQLTQSLVSRFSDLVKQQKEQKNNKTDNKK